MMMHIKDIDIKTLLPQQPPFILVDRLVHYDEIFTRSEFRIRPESIFVENDKLLEAGLIENIAQTCAARIGYINTIILKDGVHIGFIGAMKSLIINKLPEAGSILETTIEVIHEVFNITMVKAVLSCNGEVLVTCEMKISVV
jgi:predicted hotdog family 3-hydroxylacyl-ACP dehydratase